MHLYPLLASYNDPLKPQLSKSDEGLPHPVQMALFGTLADAS